MHDDEDFSGCMVLVRVYHSSIAIHTYMYSVTYHGTSTRVLVLVLVRRAIPVHLYVLSRVSSTDVVKNIRARTDWTLHGASHHMHSAAYEIRLVQRADLNCLLAEEMDCYMERATTCTVQHTK